MAPLNPSFSAAQQPRKLSSASIRIACLVIPLGAGLVFLGTKETNTRTRETHSQVAARQVKASLLPDPVDSPSGSLQQVLAHPEIIPSHHHPLLGRHAPEFKLAGSDGKHWNLKELNEAGPVVLIFYYGYHCVGCVRQLFGINRDLPLFQEAGTRVVAISSDPPEVTRQQSEQNGSFAFLVLSDPGNEVAQAYRIFRGNADKKRADLLRHGTFIIDRDGTVQWANIGDAPFRRSSALLYQLARLQGLLPGP